MGIIYCKPFFYVKPETIKYWLIKLNNWAYMAPTLDHDVWNIARFMNDRPWVNCTSWGYLLGNKQAWVQNEKLLRHSCVSLSVHWSNSVAESQSKTQNMTLLIRQNENLKLKFRIFEPSLIQMGCAGSVERIEIIIWKLKLWTSHSGLWTSFWAMDKIVLIVSPSTFIYLLMKHERLRG